MKKFFIIIIFFVVVHNANAQVKTAQEIISETCKQAAQQNKKAFIIFHASWCIWCKKMDKSLNDSSCKNFFDDNYVISHITVDEEKEKAVLNNPGGTDFLTAHHANEQGIPAWFILDKDGNVIADSQRRLNGEGFNVEGTNVGCPSNETEIEYFISVLQKTSDINSDQIAAVKKRFALNNPSQTQEQSR